MPVQASKPLALAVVLACVAVPVRAETAREALVSEWLTGVSAGLPLAVGSSRYDPATQSVVLEAVTIGTPGAGFSVSFNELSFEDPRRTVEGRFAAHAVRASGAGWTFHVDPASFVENGATEAPAATPDAPAAPGEQGGDVSPLPDDDGFSVETEVAAPFDVILRSESMLLERIEIPFGRPSVVPGAPVAPGAPGIDLAATVAAFVDWTLAIRADWTEMTGVEIRTEGAPGGDQTTTYGLIYNAGIHDGRIERSGGNDMVQVATVEGVEQRTTIAGVYMVGLDAGAVAEVIDPRFYKDGKGDGRWRAVAEQTGYNSVEVTVAGTTVSVGNVEVNGFRMRQTDVPLLPTILKIMANPDAMEEDPIPFLKDMLPAVVGLYGADFMQMNDFAVRVENGPSVGLGQLDLNAIDSDRIGAFTLRDLTVDAGEAGSGKLDLFTVNDVSFGSLLAWVEFGIATESSGEPPPGAVLEVMQKGMPAVAFYELGGLAVNLPEGTVSLDAYANTNSEFLGQLPRRYDTTFTRLQVPTALIQEPEARRQLEEMGIDTLVVSGAMTAVYDTDRGEFRLPDLTLKVDGLGLVSVDLTVGNIPLSLLDEPDLMEARFMEATVVDASLTFGNDSLVQKIFEMQAKPLNQDPEQFRKNFGAGMPLMLGFLGDAELQKRFAGPLSAFFDDPQSLTVTVKPAAPLPISALDSLEGAPPGEVIKLLGVDLTANR